MPTIHTIDLRGTICPMNYVKTKLKLEELEPGEWLEVILDEGEPMRNVPRSVKDDGHKILSVAHMDGYYKLIIEKVEG